MKILVVSEYFYPRLTGAEVVIWNIVRGLAEKGHKIYVVTSFISGTSQYEFFNNIEIFRPFSSCDIYSNKKLSKLKKMLLRVVFIYKLYRYLKHFLKKYEIDVVYNLAYVATIPSTWASSKLKIPSITNLGLWGGRGYFRTNNFFIAIFNYLMERIIINLGKHDYIRCGSVEIAEKAQKFTKTPIVNIPSPIDDWNIQKAKDINESEIKNNIGVRDDQYFLLFVGSLVPVKNVDKLIKVISKLKINYKLVIIGDGDEREKLQNITYKLSMQQKVSFLGKKKHAETLKIIKSCDVLILPSIHEVFPTVVIEALALERPVIAMSVGGVVEIESANLVKINSLNEITDDLINNMYPINNTNFISKYSLDNILNKFEKLFEEAIKRGNKYAK